MVHALTIAHDKSLIELIPIMSEALKVRPFAMNSVLSCVALTISHSSPCILGKSFSEPSLLSYWFHN